MNKKLYQLKIQLLDIQPAIWRSFIVPASITLDRLHDVVQIVMGWDDTHLHEFTIGKKIYTEYPETKRDGLVSGQYRLGDLIKQKGRTFSYLYDFGDNWEHELTLENNKHINPEPQFNITPFSIICLDGARSCPPEDVGGTPGYFEFCTAIKDPKHSEHKMHTDWIGHNHFDTEFFDIDFINWKLMQYVHWTRDRVQGWL